MDPAVPLPERQPPERTEYILGPADRSAADDTPDGHAATGEFKPPPNPNITLTADGGPPREPVPADESLRLSVPGYEILSELGRGGMGVVYLARQLDLNRPVALKMILSGEHAGVAERDRFRREAEAVAALQHPNIVQIFEVGEAGGRPYLAFEYVGGGSLASYLDGQPWPAKPAADLIESIARAVHFAHTRGVVHRDLKPANVLLGSAELGTRSAEQKARKEDPLFRIPSSALRVPKITDFGLAKRVDPTSSWSDDDSERTAPAARTRTGAVVGTPSYLAPEQAAGKNRQVGPHTDTYALGAILYELLTGRPPFRGETPLDTVLQVMGDDPVPPSKLRAKLPRDLETICLKCLQKDPRKRYASAADLADDLHRFLNGEAIAARPVGFWERAVKWMNRHPAATVMGATSGLALLSLLAVSLYFNVQLREAAEDLERQRAGAREAQGRAQVEKQKADDERLEAERQKVKALEAKQEAEAKKQEAERGVYALQLFKAAALGERDPQRALKLLDDRERCPDRLKDFTWRYIRGQVLVSEQVIGVQQGANGVPPAARVDYSPDGTLVATVSGVDPLVRVWDVAKRQLLYVLAGHKKAAHAVAFAADGRTIATAGEDNAVCLWELPANPPKTRPTQLAPRYTLTGHTNTVLTVAFSTDGRRLASGGADGAIRLWDVAPLSGDSARPRPTTDAVLREHAGTVSSLAWAAGRLYSGGSDGRVVEWRLRPGGGLPQDLFKLKKQVLSLAVTPDGELLAAAGDAEPDEDEPIIQLFRPLTDRPAGQLRGHTGLAIYDLSFAPDGKRLASAGRDGTVRVWDVAALQERAVFRPEKEPKSTTADQSARAIRGASFAPDGLAVVSGGQDGAVRLWSFAGQKEEVTELNVRAPLGAAALSADGRTLIVAERVSREVKVWTLGDPAADLDPKPTRTLRGLEAPPIAVAVNEDGSVIAAATAEGAYVWRAGSDDHPRRVVTGPAVAVAARGDDLVVATEDGRLVWLDLKTGRPRHSLAQVTGRPHLAVFSPDGRKLVTASGSALQVWDAETGELLFMQVLAHFTRRVTAVAVRPGDTTGTWEMASADDGGLVKVWEFKPKVGDPAAEDGSPPPGQMLDARERPAPPGLTDPVGALAFTADGRTLASGGVDRAVRLRDPETGQERAALAGHTDTVLLVAFRADRVLLTVGREGFARVWRAAK
jgi:serine/threonine protein kinase/WD40 repeat protein